MWEDWKEKRKAECISSINDEFVVAPENMVAMRTTELNYWLTKFMMEVRRKTDRLPALSWKYALSNSIWFATSFERAWTRRDKFPRRFPLQTTSRYFRCRDEITDFSRC